jgi:hypothetical protein
MLFEYRNMEIPTANIPEKQHPISQEQQIVLDQVKLGYNVIVDACAGAGKSTTILSVAQAIPHKQFLQITYNSMLRKEFKEKIKSMGIPNIEVHTYHSLAVKYFLKSAQTDSGIRQIVYTNIPPILSVPKYDIVVLDETQDCTLLYYHFILYFVKTMNTSFQLLVLGDYLQKIYEFKGADSRFLTEAEDIWKGFPLLQSQEFVRCTLHMSYRITNQMAKFVNNVMLGEPRLKACRDGPNVMYIRNNRTNIEKVVIYNIKKLLEDGNAQPNDIFVLGASVKGINSNIRKIENILVESGIPCLVPMFENDKIDERVIEGKVVFSTFHTVKGRQRKYVFVVGFDNTYLTFFARNIPKDTCPNTLYVGCTRATEQLYLLENNQYSTDRPLDFLKLSHLEMKQTDYIDFKGTPQTVFYENAPSSKTGEAVVVHHTTPTELIKFIPDSIVEELYPILERIFVKISTEEDEEDIEIPTLIQTKKGFYEDVSDLNGIAIPIMYYDYIHSSWNNTQVNMDELHVPEEDEEEENEETEEPQQASQSTKGEPTNIQSLNILYKIIHANIQELKPNEHLFFKKIFRELSPECQTPDDYLYMANVYQAVHERLYFKLTQIERDEYNWLSKEIVESCHTRLNQVFENETNFEIEKTILHYNMDAEHIEIDKTLEPIFGKNRKFRFSARTDIITESSIWELKCTSSLSMDHFLQVVIYAWLWKCIEPERPKKNRIFNIKTGELFELRATEDELDEIMVALLKGKYDKQDYISDENFVENCRKLLDV